MKLLLSPQLRTSCQSEMVVLPDGSSLRLAGGGNISPPLKKTGASESPLGAGLGTAGGSENGWKGSCQLEMWWWV